MSHLIKVVTMIVEVLEDKRKHNLDFDEWIDMVKQHEVALKLNLGDANDPKSRADQLALKLNRLHLKEIFPDIPKAYRSLVVVVG